MNLFRPVQLLLFALATASVGCSGLTSGSSAGLGQDGSLPMDVCAARPTPGCVCTARQPASCALPALERDGRTVCRTGRLTCRNGVWSACESVSEVVLESGEVGGNAQALITGPSQCDACNPTCYANTDTPGPTDLCTAVAPVRCSNGTCVASVAACPAASPPNGGSTGVVYDGTPGGIELPPSVMACSGAACTVTGGNPTGTWMPTGTNSEGVTVAPDGSLILGQNVSQAFAVWVANMNEGTVSKFDSRTNREVARYPSARPTAANAARPWNEYCNWSDTGNCPSRTAVDQNFDAYVANRAFGRMGTVTKYANDLADCVDRNGNGTIQTSRDANNDGQINLYDPAEFVGPGDECLLWTVSVAGLGNNDTVPRALSIGLAPASGAVGDVWVGLYNYAWACRLRPTDGSLIGCVSIWPIYPYGAVTASTGRVFFASREWWGDTRVLANVNPANYAVTFASNAPRSGDSTYGITIDGNGRIYIANNEGSVLRYNTATNTWNDYPLWAYGLDGTPRGVAADNDFLWVGLYTNNSYWNGSASRRILQFRLSDMSYVQRFNAPIARGFAGVGVSFDGAVWGIAQGTDTASRLDPATGTWIERSTGWGAYTYSDFIGFGLNSFSDPTGHYSFNVDLGATCGAYRWDRVNWAATIPANTSVQIFVRGANTVAGLSTASWIGPFTGMPALLTGAPGPVPNSRYLEVDVRLATNDRALTPRVMSATAVGYCDPITYPATGSYWHDYDSTTRCAPNERPDWGNLTWTTTTPAGTSIRFEIRSALTAAAVPAATPVTFTVPATSPPLDVGAALAAAGQANGNPFMRVTAVLLPAAGPPQATPTLTSYNLQYTCVAME